MNQLGQSIESRVGQSLERLGYDAVHVVHNGRGRVTLAGAVVTAKDVSVAISVANTVPGVTHVTNNLRVTSRV